MQPDLTVRNVSEGNILVIHSRKGLGGSAYDRVGRRAKVVAVLTDNLVDVAVARKDGSFGARRIMALHHLDEVEAED